MEYLLAFVAMIALFILAGKIQAILKRSWERTDKIQLRSMALALFVIGALASFIIYTLVFVHDTYDMPKPDVTKRQCKCAHHHHHQGN